MADISLISKRQARAFVRAHHYAVETPSTVRVAIGMQDGGTLVGVATFGYGTRPAHTIRHMFPSLAVNDYLEINRLCLLDECPRNSETWFLAGCLRMVRLYYPTVKVIFSWADGLRGKPGYVYQAASFLYGGSIWSEFYVSADGEVVHPRLLITRYGRRDKVLARELGLTKVHGYQYRYCRFICSHRDRKRLLAESPLTWSTDYPKDGDLRWVIDAGEGSRESRELPMLKGSGQFRHPAPNNQLVMELNGEPVLPG